MSLMLRRMMLLSATNVIKNLFSLNFTTTIQGTKITQTDNITTVNGTSTTKDVRGSWRQITALKANTTYTVKMEIIGGEVTDGNTSIRLYCANSTANSYKKSLADIWSKTGQPVVKQHSFTEEEISKGISLGAYFTPTAVGTVYTDFKIRIFLVEGAYTQDTFPL